MSESVPKLRQGVQSVEVGLRIAACLAAAPGAMQLKDLAAASGIPAAKVHRYLVSMVRAGLVEQHPETSLYDLGPLALELGVAALERLDVVELATRSLRSLRDELNETVALSVWGTHGVTVVRWMESTHAVIVNVRLGSVLPLLTSASGLCFLAHLPRRVTAPFVEAELASPRCPYRSEQDVAGPLESVRRHGIGRVKGDVGVLPGTTGLGAPVFNEQGEIAAALAVMGRQDELDESFAGRPARVLSEHAAELSRRLGYRRPQAS